ncbi:MAG: hypothetical protein QXO98_01915 [Sulfolobales archaeon]
MVMHKILVDELLSKELTPIGKEELSEISRYVVNMLTWCSSYNASICDEFIKSLEGFIKSLFKLRLMKHIVYDGGKGGSFDSSLINELLQLIIEYYRFITYGLLDNNGNVVVEVLKNFEYGGMKYHRKSITSIPFKDALLLAKAGYVRLMDKVFTKATT